MSKKRSLITLLLGAAGGLIIGNCGVAHGEGDDPLQQMVELLSGTLSVNVGNDTPIPVQFDPGEGLPVLPQLPPVEPILLERFGLGVVYTVPFGKVLVIETISVRVVPHVGVSGDPEVLLTVTPPDEPGFGFHLPVAQTNSSYHGLHRTVIYAEAGAELELSYRSSHPAGVTISGVLRDSIP